MQPNYRLVATQVGELVKWSSSINEINRLATATLHIAKDAFPNEAVTSQRAQLVYDWILSLAQTPLDPSERTQRLLAFCRAIVPPDSNAALASILSAAGIIDGTINGDRRAAFEARHFHYRVVQHASPLFIQGNFFHAVFEASKAYNKLVGEKARSGKDGASLMLDVWGAEGGVLRLNRGESETDRNVQDGIKFLAAGLMRAIRNPTAHEPAMDWPIGQEDCLDILSFLSFLFRKLDAAVFVPQPRTI
jgi:uncharacterized protein (TIGR02391 family)